MTQLRIAAATRAVAVALGALAATALWPTPAAAQRPPPATSAGLTESIHTVTLARGGELRLLVSRREGTRADTAVLLFAGYPGVLRLREEAGAPAYELAGNFLLRARRFLNTEQTFTVAVDCPLDRWESCGDTYRHSAQHAADVADVVAAVRQALGAKKVVIVGTSYGTVSTAYLAGALAGRIDGAVHTASFTDPRGRNAHGAPMAGFDWTRATTPQLFVHHKDDPCDVTRYASVVARKGAIPLVTVLGAGQPRGEACLAFTEHGFVGRERVVMEAIHAWITTGAVAETVGAP
jgi:pimeloyl-ACP methyl ester carboxylesterase